VFGFFIKYCIIYKQGFTNDDISIIIKTIDERAGWRSHAGAPSFKGNKIIKYEVRQAGCFQDSNVIYVRGRQNFRL
jgi:hypothetical protein